MTENEIVTQKDPQMQMFAQLMEGILKKLERYCATARPMLGGEVYLTGEEVCSQRKNCLLSAWLFWRADTQSLSKFPCDIAAHEWLHLTGNLTLADLCVEFGGGNETVSEHLTDGFYRQAVLQDRNKRVVLGNVQTLIQYLTCYALCFEVRKTLCHCIAESSESHVCSCGDKLRVVQSFGVMLTHITS